MTTQLDELVRATPATRDRYVDFLRGASILAVVFGHWFIAMPWREGGVIGVRGAVGRTPGMWLGTWLFQVMPIFFFVGGFSNLVALDSVRRGGASTGTFLWSRVKRLLIPSLFFLAVWTVIQVVLHARAIGA
ncbi:MAG TPA: acyltransferase family protein, partial [Acidimicrobiales bacterium]|nr:acyltransferase family protein [Acidimicrobiales bacterium]